MSFDGFCRRAVWALALVAAAGAAPHAQVPDRNLKADAEARLQAWVSELKAVSPSNPALRDELVAMGRDDQRLRAEGQKLMEAKGPGSPEARAVWERQAVLDTKNQARLAAIVAEHGWPGAKLVGLAAADAAFLIVQHAELAYQKKYLPLLEAAVARRDALPPWAAMLKDRVLVGDGKPQIYGTQVHMPPGATKWQLRPIADEARVDERRASVGLEPLVEYLRMFGIDYVPVKRSKSPVPYFEVPR